MRGKRDDGAGSVSPGVATIHQSAHEIVSFGQLRAAGSGEKIYGRANCDVKRAYVAL
jgi:hypothetical protein